MNKGDKILATQWQGFSTSITNIAKTAKKTVQVPTFSQSFIKADDKNALTAAINSLEQAFSKNCCQSNCCQTCQTCQKCQTCQSMGCQTKTCQSCQSVVQCSNCNCDCACNDDGG